MHESNLVLERFSAGELTPERSRSIEEHSKSCPQCAGYLKRLDDNRRQFLSLHPYADLQQACAPTAKQPWYASFTYRLSRPALIPAYGVLVVLLMLSPVIYFAGKPFLFSRNDITFKGGEALSFMVNRNDNIAQCSPGDTLHQGDELQVFYSTAKDCFVSLLSIDSYSAISWYGPDAKSPFASVHAKAGSGQAFPSAVALDAAHGQELFIALFSKGPLSQQAILQWITRAQQKTGAGPVLLQKELDASRESIGAIPIMALFQKGT